MKLHVSADIDELSNTAARWITDYIREVLEKRNRFTIALSGGSTPKKLFRLLADESYKNKVNWRQLHVFWGDERNVPVTDERNNAKMAFDELLNHLPIPAGQIHPVATDMEPVAAALSYQQLLHSYFDKQLYTFDLVLLGLGDNVHTLSLFPGYDDIIFEKEEWVKSFWLEEQDMYRITLTAPVVNSAARVAFLVSGADKAEAVQHAIADKYDPSIYPAHIIKPHNDELYWFVDKPAAANLQYPV